MKIKIEKPTYLNEHKLPSFLFSYLIFSTSVLTVLSPESPLNVQQPNAFGLSLRETPRKMPITRQMQKKKKEKKQRKNKV